MTSTDKNESPPSKVEEYLLSPPLRGGDKGEGEKDFSDLSPSPNLSLKGRGVIAFPIEEEELKVISWQATVNSQINPRIDKVISKEKIMRTFTIEKIRQDRVNIPIPVVIRKVAIFFMMLIFFLVGCSSKATNVKANAGGDQEALVEDVVTLDGLGSTGVKSAVWTFKTKPSGSSATLSYHKTLTPAFTADAVGQYEIELSINGGANTDSVIITAKKVLAIINYDPNSTITTRQRYNSTEYVINLDQAGGTLSGTGSRGPIVSYSWSEIAGPNATLVSALTDTTLQFTGPSLVDLLTEGDRYKWQPLPISVDDTKMIFKLIVADAEGNWDASTFIVYVQDNSSEIKTSGGLPNVGVGTTVYLSGPNLKASQNSPSTAVTDWNWTLTPPEGSSSKFADTGISSSTNEFPKFIPDIAGLYKVSYSSTSAGASGTIWINTAQWVGVGTIGGTTPISPQCGTCHNGSIEEDMLTEWSGAKHAHIFENSMGIYAGLAPTPYLWDFHTVGYNTQADNGGFDDLVRQAGFEFPSTGLTFSEFASQYPNIAKLSNVQCENCHGPGSQHSGDPLRIAKSFSQFGVCSQCHIEESQWMNSVHNSTGIANGAGRYQSSWLEASCARCHTSKGFATYLEEGHGGLTTVTETGAFPGITCAGCHDPHSATNETQLRKTGSVTMIVDNSTVNAGKSATCYMCHDSFNAYQETDCDSDSDGVADAICANIDQMATQYFRGVHYGTQGPVFEGKGILTDLDGAGGSDPKAVFTLTENSFHSSAGFTLAGVTGNTSLSSANNKCITCHMAQGPTVEGEGYNHLGSHSFKMREGYGIGHLQGEDTGGESAPQGELELASACTTCHPSITTSFNRTARADYDGDSVREGIQDEIKGLLLALATKIRSLDTANIDQTTGTKESSGEITVNTLGYAGSCSSFTSPSECASVGTGTCTNVNPGKTRDDYQQCNFLETDEKIRRAVWNHNLLVREGSLGIHNAAFAIQLLQKTYTALSTVYGGNSFAQDYPNATLR